jgi:hypothetical protein
VLFLFEFSIFLSKNLKVVAVFLGLSISKMNLGFNGVGIMIGWTIWTVLFPLLLELVNLAQKKNTTKGKKS